MARGFGNFLADSVLPPEIDAFSVLGYTPHVRQKVFHEISKEKIHAILVGGQAGGGKELDVLTTQIPTPDGFVYLKDIHVGDTVFGRDGRVYEVLRESPVHNHEGYRLTFDDGSSATVNDEHLWLTYNYKELEDLTVLDHEYRARRRAKRSSRSIGTASKKFKDSLSKRNSEREYVYKDIPTGTVRTTSEIVNTLTVRNGTRTNHAIPVCDPIQLPERNLPIDPYVLGVWLGDGATNASRITSMDNEIIRSVTMAGYPVSSIATQENNQSSTYYFRGNLLSQLRSLGVLGNKHIPEEYLWSSELQRLSLLQGLMDTDGNCLTNGTVEFVNTNQSLTEAVAFLARSLGHKVNIRTGIGKLNGKECSPTWKVKFRAKVPVFRLERKVERLQLDKVRRTQDFRYIVSAERVGPRDMKCLEVSSPDHLFLVTEHFIPTHNTAMLLMDALYNAANHPGMRIGCVRRTYPELEESFIAQLAKWQYGAALESVMSSKPRWNGTKRQLILSNGAVVNFIYAENLVDATRIQGAEYQAFYIDEAQLMPPEVIQHLEERLRSGNKMLPIIGMRLSANPGNIGHKYLKDRFVKPTNYGKKRVATEINEITGKTRQVAFVVSKVTDNPYIDEGYINILDSIPDKQRRAAMRDGNWDAMVGMYFEQWDNARHVVPYFPIPKEWQRYAGIDYGFSNEWAVIWVAPDNDGRLWGYREIYASGVLSRDQAKIILETEGAAGEFDVVRVADPSMWGQRGTPLTVSDDYGQMGCGIYKADNDRINGWSVVHRYLNDGPACEYHRSMDWKTCPMFHVFGETCPMFIETIPTIVRDPNKPEDALKGPGDHLGDAFRYVCMSVGTFARPIFYDDDDDISITEAPQEEVGETPKARPVQTADQLFGGFAGNLSMNSYLEGRD